MTPLPQAQPVTRPRQVIFLTLLLAAQYVGVGGLLPIFTFTSPLSSLGLRIFAVCLALFGLFTIVSVWTLKPWAAWATLALLSFKLTVDLFNWSLNLDRLLLPISEVINLAILFLVFRIATPAGRAVRRPQKIYYGFVLALAAIVGIRGMFTPADIGETLPFSVPPLHARFLGSIYLSGMLGMALSIRAKYWHEVRVATSMIAIWTGMLCVVSILHLEVFDWTRVQVWIWFVAYIAYPIIGAWIVWQQRSVSDSASGAPLSPLLRAYFNAQGVLVTLLALFLLIAPNFMAAIWPWEITPVLAQIYGAPFLSYGLGSLMMARQRDWAEVRIVAYAELLFAAGVLIASSIHSSLFDFSALATWLWFGGFGIAAAALVLFSAIPSLRMRAR